ncbi:MAG: GDP-mannose 4,6-dehydratase [bacterium]|nr:GDP-mannose 4,6-dehydratase [bacterium]
MQSESDRQKALITGITGQDGSYLAELLLAKGYEVWGLIRRASISTTTRIDHISETADQTGGRFHLVDGDLGDASSLYRALRNIRPDEIYNLAAQSHVKVSFDVPEYTGDVTGLGVVRLLEAIRDLGSGTRFYQASSSEMFGKVFETPQTESTPLRPQSPYAAAKVFGHHIVRNYRQSYGLFAVSGILFNHESPRRGDTFVTRKITLAAARIRHGLQESVSLGNLDARRDWGYAEDYVKAMWMMLQADEPLDYVIATGETHSVREFCEHAFAHVGLPLSWRGEGLAEEGVAADGRTLVRIDPRYFRPSEVDLLLGDASLAKNNLGWEPKVTFEELVRLMADADLRAASNRLSPSAAPA